MSDDELRGAELYFDCFSGIAGDMTLGALLDLGVPEAAVRGELDKLPVRNYRLTTERVKRGALVGTKIQVIVDEHDHAHHHDHDHAHHPHTHYRDIKAMLEQHLGGDVRARALAIFERIAIVEARLHGVAVAEVAFHEVGAVDSIVDIVGAAAALAWLRPARVTSRRVPLGGGTVDTAHGRLPVPAPATLELLAGAEVEAGGDSELTTPTGAGILAASVSAYGAMPSLRVVGVGWGAGDRELGDRPNLLRVVAGIASGAAASSTDEVAVVEANIDDMNPELCEPLLEALFAAGAVDAWFTPIIMKKSRPALTVAALCPPALRDAVAGALLRESTTIGVRFSSHARMVLPRRTVEVDTPWGKVPVKVAGEGENVNAAPEYEACRAVAVAAGVPVKRVYLAALAAFFRR
ncbi:MAG TPA: nickel pincer cofactor biosynthesis protein LarC [Polyangia bacterium]